MISPRLPTSAELDILAVLWRLGMATVREVHGELGKEREIAQFIDARILIVESEHVIESTSRY